MQADAPALAERLEDDAARLRARLPAGRHGDRLCSAAETVARMRPLFPRYGITRLARVTGLDSIGVPVWTAVRPNARTLAVTQGKGLDDASAQASAIMEAVELATAEAPGVPVLRATPRALAAAGRAFHRIESLLAAGAEPPGDDEAVDWLEGFDLIGRRPMLLPADAVVVDHTNGVERPRSRYWQSTDGLASGNLLVEAVTHGLCERIERDADVLWRLKPDAEVAGRCVDPRRLEDEGLAALIRLVETAGFSVRLFDITTDVAVPAFFAVVFSAGVRPGDLKHFDLSAGSGCHPLPARAALRAVIEAVQSRLTTISGARDDFEPETYAAALSADLLAYVTAEPSAAPPPAPEVTVADYLPYLLERLVRARVDGAVVVPLGLSTEGIAVAKVVVPALENPPGHRRRQYGRRAVAAMMGIA
jgi:YcaO-like protein with predicted kinase domain